MKSIHNLQYKTGSQEELLPGLEPDFPYIASYAELDKFEGGQAPWHWHKEVELFYVDVGCVEYYTPSGKTLFPAGSGGFVNSNVLHMTKPQPGMPVTAQMNHIFDATLISGSHGSLLDQKYVSPIITASQLATIPLDPQQPEEAALLRLVWESFQISPEESDYEMLLRASLSQIWCGLLHLSEPIWSQKRTSRQSDEKIKRMMRYIQEHYGEKITAAEIAAAAYLSERECFRTFRQTLDMTPLAYLQSYRVQAACEMLARGGETLAHVGQACGLGSSSYFGKVFRQHMGCTPSEYQRQRMAGF